MGWIAVKEDGQERVDDEEHCCPKEVLNCEDECLYSLGPVDEYALDGEVGKRLHQMVPIPVSVATSV